MQHKVIVAKRFSGKWSIVAALVQLDNGKVQAYMGVIPETTSTEQKIETIARWGTQLTFEEAKSIFKHPNFIQGSFEDIKKLRQETYQEHNFL